jgi:hypothetical protein
MPACSTTQACLETTVPPSYYDHAGQVDSRNRAEHTDPISYEQIRKIFGGDISHRLARSPYQYDPLSFQVGGESTTSRFGKV